MTSPNDQTLSDLPTAVLYDIFRDTATALSAAYVNHSDHATTPDESKQWWDKVLALRDATDATDPDDRTALTHSIQQWRREANELRAG
jgi:hypothetical protein